MSEDVRKLFAAIAPIFLLREQHRGKAAILLFALCMAGSLVKADTCSYTYSCGPSSQCAAAMGGSSGTITLSGEKMNLAACEIARKEAIPSGSQPCTCPPVGVAAGAASTGSLAGDALNAGANLWIVQNIKNPYTSVFAQKFTQSFLTELFGNNNPEADRQRQMADEAVRKQQQDAAERARAAEQQRVDEMFARLNIHLKLSGSSTQLTLKTGGFLGDLSLKLSGYGSDDGLKLKLGDSSTPAFGIQGLHGIYVGGPAKSSDTAENGGGLKLKSGDSFTPSPPPAAATSDQPAHSTGLPGLPGIYLNNAEPTQAAQLANSATTLTGPERIMAEDAALQAAQKNPMLTAPSDDPFVTDYQREAQGYDAALKRRQDAWQKASEAEGHVQAEKAAIDYARVRIDAANATQAQRQAFQEMLGVAQSDEDASAAARQIFEQANAHLSIVRDRASDALASLALPAAIASSPNRVIASMGNAPSQAPQVNATKVQSVSNSSAVVSLRQSATPEILAKPPLGGQSVASSVEMCIADASNKVAGGLPVPSTEDLYRQLEQAKEAYGRMVETEEHELEDRADWIKDLNKATLDMSLGLFDKGLKGLIGPENKTLNSWQSGMRHEVMSNRKQIQELSALADAERDAALNTALHDQIFNLNMRNQLLHTGLNAVRNAKTMYHGYEMAVPARDFGLWVTDSGDPLNNPGYVLQIAPLEKAKRLDLSAIVPKDQSGAPAMLAAAKNSGGLEGSMDGVRQLLKITMNDPGVKAWLEVSLGLGTGITELHEGLSLTIDVAYDLSVGYAGFARLIQIKKNVAQFERAKAALAKRIDRINAEIGCYRGTN